jgi:hypothetical protein
MTYIMPPILGTPYWDRPENETLSFITFIAMYFHPVTSLMADRLDYLLYIEYIYTISGG